jgi:hypothetical protein
MTNGKYLDPNMAFTPLKHNINIMKPKLILREDDVPVNFTHLGQYVYTSGNRIFEKRRTGKRLHVRQCHNETKSNVTKVS